MSLRPAAALLAFAAFALLGAAPPATASISYQLGPCFGSCAGYRFTVNADGTGLFEGESGTALRGRHPFRITPAQFRVFAAALAPIRPVRGDVSYDDPAHCRGLITDEMTAVVTWQPARGRPQRLLFYYGCEDPRNAAVIVRLREAPGLLPIRAFILGHR
jgi:Domain of unknown function (DUF6438)